MGQRQAEAPKQSGATILVYHSVADVWGGTWIDPRYWIPPEIFESHLEFLQRARRVIGLSEWVAAARENRTSEPGTVVLTFDDAYLDHLTVVQPLLQKYRLSATFFVPPAWVGDRAPWSDDLYGAIRHRRTARLDLGPDGRFDLRWPGHAREAYAALAARLSSMAQSEAREEVLRDVRRQLETYGHAPRRTLSWEELRTLTKTPNVEVGAHGTHHLSMPNLRPDQARAEVHDAVRRLEAELGVRPRYFAYPYGHHDDRSDALVAEFGFDAVMVASAQSGSGSQPDLRHVPRSSAQPDLKWLARATE